MQNIHGLSWEILFLQFIKVKKRIFFEQIPECHFFPFYTLFCIKFFFASYATGPIAVDLCLVKALTPSVSDCPEETIKFENTNTKGLLCLASHSESGFELDLLS